MTPTFILIHLEIDYHRTKEYRKGIFILDHVADKVPILLL